ncbi:MAG: NADH-quinone oxidoreductase subunit H, partial [Desulfofustis sp.]|nr:NADH-quinone oxidoreductase subunit H [Desulfofustis sp.]
FNTETLVTYARPVVIAIMLGLPVIGYFFGEWMKRNNRSHYYRENDPRQKETTVYIALLWSLVAILEIVLLIYLVFAHGGVADRILVALLQIGTFLFKTFLMCFVYVWVRWTLPRFRYDQLQKIGWEKLLPLALLNIFITSAIIVSFG